MSDKTTAESETAKYQGAMMHEKEDLANVQIYLRLKRSDIAHLISFISGLKKWVDVQIKTTEAE